MIKIDINDENTDFFDKKITIQGIDYIFKFRRNQIYDFWSFTIFDENENLIFSSKCVCNFDVFVYEKTNVNLPKGSLMFYSNSDKSFASGDDFKDGKIECYFVSE